MRFEKLDSEKHEYDIAIQINGYWLFSLLLDKNLKSLILFNHIIIQKPS